MKPVPPAFGLIQRRAFLISGLAVTVAGPVLAAPVAPPGGRIAFDVYRKGRKIGEHVLTFQTNGDALTMSANVHIAVGLGPVTLFNYRHQQTERWKGGRFDSLETTTVQNGDRIKVSATRTDGGVKLEGGKPSGSRTLPAGALPLTHWNRASLSGPLFNPQDGKMMRLSISAQGPAPVMMANGASITAQRIALTGETSIEDWYDPTTGWTGLKAKAQDGSTVEYRRI